MRIPLAGLAFAAAVRMVDGIHRHAAHRRADTAPALRAGFADLAQVVLVVADFTDRRAAGHVDSAHLARTQAHRDVGPFAGDDLHRGTGAARELPALAGLELDAMNLRTDGDILERQRIPDFDRRLAAGQNRIADRDTFRRHDVTALAVAVED